LAVVFRPAIGKVPQPPDFRKAVPEGIAPNARPLYPRAPRQTPAAEFAEIVRAGIIGPAEMVRCVRLLQPCFACAAGAAEPCSPSLPG